MVSVRWMGAFVGLLWLVLLLVPAQQQEQTPFYSIYPPLNITDNEFPLNSSTIDIGAFLILFIPENRARLTLRSLANILCIECQRVLINANSSLLPDTEMRVTYYDTSYLNASQASIVALEYSLDPVHIASLGPDSSSQLLPIVEYLQSIKVANYNNRLLSSVFSSIIDFPNLRTVTVSDTYMIKNYMQLISFFGWNWVGAAFSDDDTGQSGRYGFAALANVNVFFPCYYIIGVANDSGMQALVKCLETYSDVKALLLWGTSESVTNVIRYFYHNTTIDYLTFIVNTQAAKEIVYSSLDVPPSFYQGLLFLDMNYDLEKGFTDCVSKATEPGSPLAAAIKSVYGDYLDCVWDDGGSSGLPVCEGPLFNFTNKPCRCDVNGIDGILRPYASGSVLYRDILQGYALALHTIKYNCESLNGDFCGLQSITGEKLLRALSQIDYIGFSGLISFNETNSTNRVNGTLDVFQVVPEPDAGSLIAINMNLIGFMLPATIYTYDGIYLEQDRFQFNTGGNTVPISVAVPETTDLDSGFWPCFIFALCIVGLVLVAGALFFTIWKFDTPIVRKAGRVFLLLILLGTGCAFTANLLWSVQPSIFICIFKGILSFIAGTAVCGALFAKSVEFYQIFSNYRRQRYEESRPQRVGVFFFCLGLVVVNTIIWWCMYQFVAGPILCTSFQSTSDYYYWYVGCAPETPSADNVYIILWISLTTAFNFYAVIMLALAWSITSVYSLARCIVFVESNLIVLAVTITPLYYSLPIYPNYALQQYLVRSLSTTFAAAFTLAFIFVPLIYSHYKRPDDDSDFKDPADGDGERTGFSRIRPLSTLSQLSIGPVDGSQQPPR